MNPSVQPAVRRIAIPKPPVGGKTHTIRSRGWFCLEEGPGLIWHCLCTHTGTKGIELFDGYIGEDGHPVKFREIFKLDPSVLGVWHLNAGFQYGLLAHVSEQEGMPGSMTLVWMHKNENGEKKAELESAQSKSLTIRGTEKSVICKKDCVLYQVQVTHAGLGAIRMLNGHGEELFTVPLGIAGSFVLEHVYCRGGLVAEIDSTVPVSLTLTWREVKSAE